MGSEKIMSDGAVHRLRPDLDAMRDQLLSIAASRFSRSEHRE
jgi:hypothetical protein